LAESYEQLRLEFLAETEDTLAELQRDLSRLGASVERGAPEADVVDRVFRTTHSLKGVAGMFGLDEMSAVSHAMESLFDQLRDGRLRLDGTVLDLLYQGHESLHQLLATARGRSPAKPGSAEAVIREVERYLEQHAPARDPATTPDDPLAVVWTRLDVAAKSALRREWESGATIVVVEAAFAESGFEAPFRALLDAVRTWGTVHGSSPGDRDEATGMLRLRVVVSGSGEAFELMRAIGPLGGEVLPCEPALVLARSPAADAGSPRADGPATTETLRVPVHRVDGLLSGLGEVIQAKLALDETTRGLLDASTSRSHRTATIQALRHLDRRIRRLQEKILRVRMVSLAPTFQLLERTLREATRATGKEARLATRGERVELDKRVVEALAEPLLHLVRNAVDHGLEHPDAREAAGKPRTGTVRIDARSLGGRAEIDVSDDGAGLDLERIERKARETGLISGTEPARRGDLLDLIFVPGFTVRDRATAISGRGVGLDAVRTAVAELGGHLSVHTGPEGTAFRLRVPASLAVAKALLVETAGQEFFLPLASVARVGNVRRADVERSGEEEVLVRDGRTIPVDDLARVLGLDAAPAPDPAPAVFLGLAEKRVALRVHRLGRQREIVVRTLGDLLPAVPGVAGATELGDGKTVLILDPAALLERTRKAVGSP